MEGQYFNGRESEKRRNQRNEDKWTEKDYLLSVFSIRIHTFELLKKIVFLFKLILVSISCALTVVLNAICFCFIITF